MIKIPYVEYVFSFSRSSGAGGQNVNKVNSKATLSWGIDNSPSCQRSVKERFKTKFKRFVFDGRVVITSQKHRSQNMNIDDCISKLNEMLISVEFAPKARRSTKPTRNSVKRRLDSKKKDSNKKKMRSEKF